MENTKTECEAEKKASKNCLPLIQSAHLNIYRQNTFRITGLPVDASEKEIKKHADKLKMMEELGYGQGANPAAFSLDPPPSVDQIREAIHRLKEPEHRLVDEFFWFWPKEFGKSANDPAIQAILAGDSGTAYDIWTRLETCPDDYIAWHNIAVMMHLVALDWTHYHFSSEVDEERECKIKGYWKESLYRWERIATDDRVWDALKARIRGLDDPRLTTGFARRMREAFPEALDKINAEAALRFAEQGRTDWAKTHIDFMNETHQGLDDVEKTAELILTPIRNRILNHIKTAKDECDKKPENGADAAGKLIEQCSSLQSIFELFHGSDSHHKTELFDDVATTVVDCVIDYVNKTQDNESFVAKLKECLHFATGVDVRQRIQKSIDIGEGNIRGKSLKPFFAELKKIEDSKDVAEKRLTQINQQIMPRLLALTEAEGAQSSLTKQMSDSIATVLSQICVDAHNNESDFEISLKAIEMATKLVKDPELKKRFGENLRQVLASISERKKSEVSLKIRGDEVEINSRIFRYNNTEIKIPEIIGIRAGTKRYYIHYLPFDSTRISVIGKGGQIDIECKRFGRSQQQADADFTRILHGILKLVIPSLTFKIAKSILSGQIVKMGEMRIAADGVYMHSRALLRKKEHFVPWSDIRFETSSGILAVRSVINADISESELMYETWNAFFFQLIDLQIKKLKAKK
ncbi:MAG: hypothetical protein F2923_00340 [Actinobacteria bacterium]|nr:hypothetical protein [Actinomycetota bacterium]